MILILGATGRLGQAVTRRLLREGKRVRVMARESHRAEDLGTLGAEIVMGDIRDPASAQRACEGVERVVSSVQALTGKGENNPRTVDDAGNRCLIDAAKVGGVRHFLLISAVGAAPDNPLEFFRIKYGVEEHLRASRIPYTIVRPTAFMEFWAELVGKPIAEKGATTIFGRGRNPINFVSVDDVAQLVVMALDDPKAQNRIIEIGGPENLTLDQVAETFERVLGRRAKKRHVPLQAMRVMRTLVQPINPALSRQIDAGIYQDTHDQTFDPSATLADFPLMLTRLEDVVRKEPV